MPNGEAMVGSAARASTDRMASRRSVSRRVCKRMHVRARRRRADVRARGRGEGVGRVRISVWPLSFPTLPDTVSDRVGGKQGTAWGAAGADGMHRALPGTQACGVAEGSGASLDPMRPLAFPPLPGTGSGVAGGVEEPAGGGESHQCPVEPQSFPTLLSTGSGGASGKGGKAGKGKSHRSPVELLPAKALLSTEVGGARRAEEAAEEGTSDPERPQAFPPLLSSGSGGADGVGGVKSGVWAWLSLEAGEAKAGEG